MSFSDMMQSGHGPGVVGILLAVLVLGGFGVLFLFAVDGGEADPALATEAIIQQHDTEIHELKLVIKEGNTRLEVLPKLKETARKLGETTSEADAAARAIDDLNATITAVGKQTAALQEEFAAYKQLYREQARAAVKGERMASLTTLDGKTYKDVIIREVHAAGMRIGFDGGAGSTTIPADKLPPELQDRFQFDPAELAEHRRREQEATARLTQTDAQHKEAQEQQRREQEESDARERKDKARRDIPTLSARINTLDAEHERLKLDMEREKLKTVRNTEAIRRKMEENRALREKLQAELVRAQAILNS
jgi:hypothetical protein